MDMEKNERGLSMATEMFSSGSGYTAVLLRTVSVVAVALLMLTVTAPVAHASVAGTKHNFGSLSKADVKTTQNSEICVFCHTPHNSNPANPMWNRDASSATYNIYASQTVSAVLGQPTGSSKLCLSCHDGTIALGSMLNLPGKASPGGILAVTGPGVTSGMLTSVSTAFIGTDLSDDHPISFDYSLSYPSNTEIRDSATLPLNVKLDSNGQVQCRSCHDPHGTAYPKMMVEPLDNGAICNTCHDLRYWSTMPSVHSTSTATWNGLGENPFHEDLGVTPDFSDDTPALQSCVACHRSHTGSSGTPLLKGTNPVTQSVDAEEWTCLNCHNGNVAVKDMEPVFNRISKHNVKATVGAHVPSRAASLDPVRESAVNLGGNRHAECADCHNSHGTMPGNHKVGDIDGNIIGPNILGSWGVKPSPWPLAGTAANTYQEVDFTTTTAGFDNLEGYLCLKCHSYYAYGFLPPNAPSGNANGSTLRQSDMTKDFNVNNMSVHPVFASGKNKPPVSANINWPINGLGLSNTFRYVEFTGGGARAGYYNVKHDSMMTCSDCHGSSVSSDPVGPHGSDNKWILKNNTTGIGSLQNFCYNCHRRDVYGDQGYVGIYASYSRVSHPPDGLGVASPFYAIGADTGNNSNKFSNLCLTCHGGGYDAVDNVIKGVHGSNGAAGSSGDPLGYRMMNGACVESYTRPSTLSGGSIGFRAVAPLTDEVCNKDFSTTPVTISTPQVNYDCNIVADCSN